MDGSSCDEDSLRGRGIEEGKLDGNRSCEQNPGSVLRRGIKFSSADEFLNFLNEVDEVNDESSLSDPSSGSFEVEEDKKQSDLRCKSAVVEGGTAVVNEVNAIEEGVADEGGVKKKECGKKLRRENLRRHIREVHHQKKAEVDKSGWPECGICGKKYFKRGNVKNHIFTVHLEEIDQEDFKKHIMPGQAEFGWKERKDKLDEDNKSGWPECGLCGKKYPTRQIVKKHIFTVHLEEMDHEDFKKHIIPVQEEFECEQCKKKFSKKERLERHARVYHMEEFKCEKCGKRFSRKENLKRHITVRQELKFECELCHRKFSLRCEKMRHLKNEHKIEAGDEAKMKCEVCDRKLKRFAMKDHMKRRHKIEYVECAQCGETFNNETKLETHKSLVHVVKLQCDLCDEEFELNEALAAHKDLDHREFKCDEQGCGFKAKTEADLRNHTNQHYLESGQLWLIKRYIM